MFTSLSRIVVRGLFFSRGLSYVWEFVGKFQQHVVLLIWFRDCVEVPCCTGGSFLLNSTSLFGKLILWFYANYLLVCWLEMRLLFFDFRHLHLYFFPHLSSFFRICGQKLPFGILCFRFRTLIINRFLLIHLFLIFRLGSFL